MLNLRPALFVTAALLAAANAFAQNPAAPSPFTPDPATVQRYGPGYRYPQEGWIVVHVEGKPYERGVQQGRLLASEIQGYLNCYSTTQSPTAPKDGWKLTRTIVNTSFLRGFDPEYLEEMQGIADGATAAGARFDNRPVDVIDIAALNMWAELMTLDDANNATPTGLEGKDLKEQGSGNAGTKRTAPERCSAFAATGKATADHHPIIGHITMFGLYPSGFFNVWLDVKPESGHRILMQSYPGGIYSGMDYYLTDAGLAMVETTIDQTRFDIGGQPLASRVRKALQYSDSIDGVVETLKQGNNGLYNNEWLLADMKTDEIAMYELGTRAGKLWRSSKNEWFGGTEGFYWGCNNTKDLAVRLETIPSVNDRPANMVWHPADRDLKWIQLYEAGKGKMDEQFAQRAFTTPPLCSAIAVDAKFTTARLAKNLESWGTFGPPLGQTWTATPDEVKKYKDIKPMVSNPWTILGPGVSIGDSGPLAADLNDPSGDRLIGTIDPDDNKDDAPSKPAWHGTILPASDGSIWLASAFAEYEKMVSTERGYAAAQPTKCLCADDYDKAATSLFAARARYFEGVRAAGTASLSKIRQETGTDGWYKIASGKGVLVLAELRRTLGDDAFLDMMDKFGRAHAGKPATTADFISAASAAAGKDLGGFFEYWINERGLPTLTLASADLDADDDGPATVKGVIVAKDGIRPSSIEVTLEGMGVESTTIVPLDRDGAFEISSPMPVTRIVVDKYARCARANGGEADLGSFTEDLDHTLIIYGTTDDAAANREAALACQKSLRTAWINIDIPVKADTDCPDAAIKDNHLILFGRPGSNSVTRRLAGALPISFGPESFNARGETYANAGSGVAAAAVSPLNRRYTATVIAGNSGAATLAHADCLANQDRGNQVRVFEASGRATSLVIPAPELTKDFQAEQKAAHGE